MGQTSYNSHRILNASVTQIGYFLDMAADILRFFPEKDPFVTRPGTHLTSELLQALGQLALAQEQGVSRESLTRLGRNVDAAVRRMNEFSDIDSAA